MARYTIIGDVHGRYDLLCEILEEIDPELGNGKYIFLGDMIDRGPDSFNVVEIIKSICESGKGIALVGNHENMMLDYLDWACGDRYHIWFYNGNRQTIDSYGKLMRLYGTNKFPLAIKKSSHLAWLKTLPCYYETDEIWCSHAPVPKQQYRQQNSDFRNDIHTLTWTSNPDLIEGEWEHPHGKLAICGHIHQLQKNNTTVREYPNIVYADTGCGCADFGKLSALIVEDGKLIKYIQVPGDLI